MTQAFLKGFSNNPNFNMDDVTVSSQSGSNFQALSERYGIHTTLNNCVCVDTADILILAVKPQQLQAVIEEIRPCIKPHTLVISIAAAITLESLADWFMTPTPILRMMPNTAISIQKGSIALCANEQVSKATLGEVMTYFKPLGSLYLISESQFDAFIAASGSGIAFIYQIMDDFIQALNQENLEGEVQHLVLETFKAAAEMALSSQQSLQANIEEVTSKAGTTIEGLQVLRQANLSHTFKQTFEATLQRSKVLSQTYGSKK